MKRMTAAVLLITAISAPALAETPTQRELHSWDYVNQVATSSQAPAEAPMMDHHEQHNYYHHDGESHGMHHHMMKHHHHMMKHHHHMAKHHHHTMKHHHKDAAKKMDSKPADQK